MSTNKPLRTYKVVYENLKTREQNYIYVESNNSYEASEAILANLGDDYDLIMCISAKPKDLQ